MTRGKGSERLWAVMKSKFLKYSLGILGIIIILFVGISIGKNSPQPVNPLIGEPEVRRGLDMADAPQAEKASFQNAQAPEAGGGSTTSGETSGSISDRLVIKTGNLSLLVRNTQETVEKVKTIAETRNGFVLSARTYFTDEKEQHLKGTVTIKVPSVQFEETVKELKELALKVTSEHVQGQDVTEEYTDLESRLRNLEATEEQLLEIMDRAGEISDVLEVQRELTNTRRQIETIKGRMEYLAESADMSTISVHIATQESELPVVEEQWKPLRVAKNALRSTVSFWQSVGSGVIWLAIFTAPLAILITLGIFLRKTLHKTKKS